MPNLTLSMIDGEPVVEVQIGVTPRRSSQDFVMKGLAVPSPMLVCLLVDTGSSHSMVAKPVLRALGISAAGTSRIHTATGGEVLSEHDVSLLIHGKSPGQGWFVPEVFVSAANDDAFSGSPYVGLIGRDVLGQGLMIYNGRNAHLTLAY